MSFGVEIDADKRFQFGKNWRSFLSVLSEERILEAEKSLCGFLGVDDLRNKRFLDIGSGSGLFSLAARRLGARVHSFDYDVQSVECSRELKERFFPDDPCWDIEQGSVLDRPYMERLAQFDICYAWGVLHHTDAMWQALYNAHLPVAYGGHLYIAIYNDQGAVSAFWRVVKKAYCANRFGKACMAAAFYPTFFFAGLLLDVVRLRAPGKRYREHKKKRGMSLLHDWRDWLGGYPYEVATPTRIRSFFENLGFDQNKVRAPDVGFGNNEFLFRKRKAWEIREQ